MRLLDKYFLWEDIERLAFIESKLSDEFEQISKRYRIPPQTLVETRRLAYKLVTFSLSKEMWERIASTTFPNQVRQKLLSDGVLKEPRSLRKRFNKTQSMFLKLVKREQVISYNEFATLYAKRLLKLKGQSTCFDKYLDFLFLLGEQGVVSTMREFNCPGEFGNLEELFANEEITIEAVEDFCKKNSIDCI